MNIGAAYAQDAMQKDDLAKTTPYILSINSVILA